MTKILLATGLLVLSAAFDSAGPGTAFARGAAANIMNSPGYQRRLQESRGYVTNQSGSVLSSRPAPEPARKVRRRR